MLNTGFFFRGFKSCRCQTLLKDYVLDPQNNQHPNAKDYSILQKVYGTAPVRKLRRFQQKLVRQKDRVPHFISFTDKTNQHRWRLLGKNNETEIHELDIGNGDRMIARLWLAGSPA